MDKWMDVPSMVYMYAIHELIGFGAETGRLDSCANMLFGWTQGLLGTTDTTQSRCQQVRRGKYCSFCMRIVHELELSGAGLSCV